MMQRDRTALLGNSPYLASSSPQNQDASVFPKAVWCALPRVFPGNSTISSRSLLHLDFRGTCFPLYHSLYHYHLPSPSSLLLPPPPPSNSLISTLCVSGG